MWIEAVLRIPLLLCIFIWKIGVWLYIKLEYLANSMFKKEIQYLDFNNFGAQTNM